MERVEQPLITAAWGKAVSHPTPHPLVCHAIDTTAVARRLLDQFLAPRCREELRTAFAPLGDADGWIVLLCGLHDLGKYSPAFQALRAELAKERLGTTAASDIDHVTRSSGALRTDTPHGLLTTVHMKDTLRSWGATGGTADALARVLGGHHGRFPSASSIRQARASKNHHGAETWAAWRDHMIGELVRLWGLPEPASLPWHEVCIGNGAAVGLAALTSVSDWIASDPRNFPYASSVTNLSTYRDKAQSLAEEAVERVGWSPWQPPADTSYASLFPEDTPRPVQNVVERWSTGCREPVLLIVEAPTGEGKTKAALQAMATLVHDLGLAGTYIAMPTRATSDQMLSEIEQLLQNLGDTTAVHLLHSTAAEDATPKNVGEDDTEDSDVAAKEWFTRKRGLLASLGVGTVDQALKAAIRSGHQFVRLGALSNKVVVFDEIHAYDTYMSKLLDRLLAWLGRLGTSVILLSATLPTRRRQELLAAWHAGASQARLSNLAELPPTSPYPRVTRAQAGTAAPQVEPAGTAPLNTGRIVRLEQVSDESTVSWLLNHVRDGGCAAVIHNLVQSRAMRTYESLEAAVAKLPEAERPELFLITGGLPATQRTEVEAALRRAFGPGGVRPLRAIVVGTQVLEQSLDLDFDAMISDLAPVDALIQRAGRVHRHRRDTSRRIPVLAITGVTDRPSGPVFPKHLTKVYEPMVLLRTWAVLRDRTELRSPEEVPELIDLVYGPPEAVPCPDGWEAAWRQAADRLERVTDNHDFDAAAVYVPSPAGGIEELPDLTARVTSTQKTRRRSGRRD